MDLAAYYREIESWRKQKDADLRAEDGWLALAGLFWLKDGRNRVGSDPGNDVILPSGRAPEHLGVIDLCEGEALLRVSQAVTIGGKEAIQATLSPDVSDSPTIIKLDALTMVLIQRGKRFGIRLWDNQKPERVHFAGREWFPIHGDYRVEAQYCPYELYKMLLFPTELGDIEEEPVVGKVCFTLGGQGYKLEALGREQGRLFLVFKDGTSAGDTYPSGRYLVCNRPENGQVILDFNQAYNPPCAFTDYATCTLAPPQNVLAVKIEAGERYEPTKRHIEVR